MTMNLVKALKSVEENQVAFVGLLKDFTQIRSVSTDPENSQNMLLAAQWVVNELRNLGFQKTNIYPTAQHPIVMGEYRSEKPGVKTLLIYGHYDVQPPDPLDLWQTEPFLPTIRDGKLYARGASDMKGQVVACILALQALKDSGGIPMNIKFIVEGEEEIGSPNLAAFLKTHREELSCDFILNPDAGMISKELPTIVYTLRGLAYFELRVYGPVKDLHSGVFGGVVHNPAQALCELIAGMHDEKGTITIPGFYDRVIPLKREERVEMASSPMDEAYYLQQTGVPHLYGEEGYLPVERVGARPTLDVNGLFSGFTGSGSKTVIPAWAMAKISMRLVADQNPNEVHQQLLNYLQAKAPDTIRWEVIPMHGGHPSISDRDLPATKALAKALETVWGRAPVFKREGGSVPVVGDMQRILGVDSVLTGFGLPDDNIHSPNERLDLETWYKGIMALVHFFYNLSEF